MHFGRRESLFSRRQRTEDRRRTHRTQWGQRVTTRQYAAHRAGGTERMPMESATVSPMRFLCMRSEKALCEPVDPMQMWLSRWKRQLFPPVLCVRNFALTRVCENKYSNTTRLWFQGDILERSHSRTRIESVKQIIFDWCCYITETELITFRRAIHISLNKQLPMAEKAPWVVRWEK